MNTNFYITLLVIAIVSAGCAAPSPEAEAANPEAPQVGMVPPEKAPVRDNSPAPNISKVVVVELKGNQIYDTLSLFKHSRIEVRIERLHSLEKIELACQYACNVWLGEGFEEQGKYHFDDSQTDHLFSLTPAKGSDEGRVAQFIAVKENSTTNSELGVSLMLKD